MKNGGLKRALLGSAAATVIAAMVGGAGLGEAYAQNAPTSKVVSGPVNWSGFYLGGFVSYGEANFGGGKDVIQPPGSGTATFASGLDLSGINGGALAGFNWQFNSGSNPRRATVVGIEADVAVGSKWEDTSPGSTPELSGRVDLLATVRGRLGVAFDRILVFGTGGVAFTDAKMSFFDSSSEGIGQYKFNDVGGVVGGGAQVALTPTTSLKIEGLYFIFDEDSGLLGFGTGNAAEFDDAYVVRLGANIQFH